MGQPVEDVIVTLSSRSTPTLGLTTGVDRLDPDVKAQSYPTFIEKMFATVLQNQEADQELRRGEVDLLRKELKLSRANMAKVNQLCIEEKAKKPKKLKTPRRSIYKERRACQSCFHLTVRMSPGEDLYSAITRFEWSMVANGIDRFKWAEG